MDPIIFIAAAFSFLCAGGGAVAATLGLQKSSLERKRTFWGKYWIFLLIANVLGALILLAPPSVILLAHTTLLLLSGKELLEVSRHRSCIERNIIVLIFLVLSAGVIGGVLQFSSRFLIFLFSVVCLTDAFSQVVGQSLGRHKIFPLTSPTKTWEGALGGLLIAQVATFTFSPPSFSLLQKLLCGFGIALAAQLGDYSGSYYKRRLGIKDFSSAIPFHGGFIDRFNSYFTALALGAFVLLAFDTLLQIDETLPAMFLIAVFLAVTWLVSMLGNQSDFRSETLRKIYHIAGGTLAFSFPILFSSRMWPILLCVLCACFLAITQKRELLTSVHGINRKSWGATLFPLGISVIYFCSFTYFDNSLLVFSCALGTLTYADGVAALVGKQHSFTSCNKTSRGSLAFLSVAIIVHLGAICAFSDLSFEMFLISIFSSFATTVVERCSNRGWDNITVPLTVLAVFATIAL